MSLCKLTIKEYFPIAPLLIIQILYIYFVRASFTIEIIPPDRPGAK